MQVVGCVNIIQNMASACWHPIGLSSDTETHPPHTGAHAESHPSPAQSGGQQQILLNSARSSAAASSQQSVPCTLWLLGAVFVCLPRGPRAL